MATDDSYIKRAQKEARDSAIRGNEISAEYVKNLNIINGRLIVIALGSASLFITFIGILFGSERNVANLEFNYMIWAIVCFLVSSTLLLTHSWLVSMFRFRNATSNHLSDRLIVLKEGIKIAKENDIVKNGHLLNEKAKKKYIAEQTGISDKIEAQYNKDNHLMQTFDNLSKLAALTGYMLLLVGYLFTLFFFLGVICLLRNT